MTHIRVIVTRIRTQHRRETKLYDMQTRSQQAKEVSLDA